jgi:hypothetical protein
MVRPRPGVRDQQRMCSERRTRHCGSSTGRHLGLVVHGKAEPSCWSTGTGGPKRDATWSRRTVLEFPETEALRARGDLGLVVPACSKNGPR